MSALQSTCKAVLKDGVSTQFSDEDNPNNNSDLFKYYYGWEGSNVIYIEYTFREEGSHYIWNDSFYKLLTRMDFIELCKSFASQVKADESWIVLDEHKNGTTYLKWRLWWD